MRSWLAGLPKGQGRYTTFKTHLKVTFGGATGAITCGLKEAGYRFVGKGKRFLVKGSYGPLKDGELERARQWGAELAQAMG